MNDAPGSAFSELSGNASINISQLGAPGTILGSAIPLADILGSIFNRLHPLFSFDCGVVLIYDEQLTVIKEAYTSTWLSDTEQVHAEVLNQPSELSALQKSIAGFAFPVVKSAAEWLEDEGTNHTLVNGASHYNNHCYIPLEVDNKILGTLELHNSITGLSTECLAFCSNIADLIAELIYLQRNRKATEPAAKSQPFPEPKKITFKADTLDELIASTEFFPAGAEKLKAELRELAACKAKLEDEQLSAPQEPEAANNYPGIIGGGKGMNRVFALMDQVSQSDSTVLILGESGTGKELIAKAIHEGSDRRDKTMIKVNCAAIPANLIESELFGHEKGAFTGATDRRIGKFELADNSTIFLDEIGELPLDLQVKLLRVLQEQEIERVGGKNTIKVNVRIVSATNRNLLTEVEKGRFRLDLYYRLNIFPIALPALRERTEDIPLLASFFLTKYARKANRQITGFTQKAIKQLSNYSWPGNVREMEHLIERQVLLSTKPIISEVNIPATAKTITGKDGARQMVKTIDENERDHIFAVLQLCKGRISGADGAAKLLGVPATTLNSKIKRLGLGKKHF